MNFPTHNDNAVECQSCGEIELIPTRTENGIETWECPCGYEENLQHWWAQQDQDDEWISENG